MFYLFMNKSLKFSQGLAQIPLMIVLLLMALAVPVATQLVQNVQDGRSSAAPKVVKEVKISDYDRRQAQQAAVRQAVKNGAEVKNGALVVTSAPVYVNGSVRTSVAPMPAGGCTADNQCGGACAYCDASRHQCISGCTQADRAVAPLGQSGGGAAAAGAGAKPCGSSGVSCSSGQTCSAGVCVGGAAGVSPGVGGSLLSCVDTGCELPAVCQPNIGRCIVALPTGRCVSGLKCEVDRMYKGQTCFDGCTTYHGTMDSTVYTPAVNLTVTPARSPAVVVEKKYYDYTDCIQAIGSQLSRLNLPGDANEMCAKEYPVPSSTSGTTSTTSSSGGSTSSSGTTTKKSSGGSNSSSDSSSGCEEQCPGGDGVLRSCSPADTDGTSKDLTCSVAGRSAMCGGQNWCCATAGGTWAQCPVPTLAAGASPVLNYKISFGRVMASSSQCVVSWPLQFIVLSGGESKTYVGVLPDAKSVVNNKVVFSGSLTLTGFTKTTGVAVFVKGPKHSQMKYGIPNQTAAYNKIGGELVLTSDKATSQVYDFSGYPLLPGDVVDISLTKQDGIINGVDYAYIRSKSLVHDTVGAGGYLKGDLDGNCQVNSNDVNIYKISLQEKQGQLY